MRNGLPIIALLVLGLFITIGAMTFGSSMQMMDDETNFTKTNQTYEPFVISYTWWIGIAVIVIILALVFALWALFIR